MNASDVPFGLDSYTFSALIATGILLASRIIEALLPKGKSFRFTKSWYINGEKVEEEVTEVPKPDEKEDDDDSRS